nr:hypothetical protein [uncultured Desulfobacter sp.]
MNQNESLSMLRQLMLEFAGQTGLLPQGKPLRRYLWTDAFAVCNFLELYRRTGDDSFKSLALLLVNQVHEQLGRHREDDARTGWLSGLDEGEGRRHPTAGGLRIGKKMNERGLADPLDEDLEWDRDGQYYHYLTKWMHALNRVSVVTADPVYNIWARELARTVHARFVFTPPALNRQYIYWKMSIDLSRSLVPTMGHHDPVDGFITYSQLQAIAADTSPQFRRRPDLRREIAELDGICQGKSWVTDDPLGIGGLLCCAYQVAQMIGSGYFQRHDLLEALLNDALLGLEAYAARNPLVLNAEHRLAFRELGLTIGMHAAERLSGLLSEKNDLFRNRNALRQHTDSLMRYKPLIETIENFWLEDSARKANTWREHLDINMVMLATSLAPDGFLQSS